MCLILFAWNTDPDQRLVVAANRDEYHRRKTAPLSRWPDLPIIGGRDRVAGGTWMGLDAVNPSRVAMVTNVRVGRPGAPGPRSRGALPVQFLVGADGPGAFAQRLRREGHAYLPVNLLVGDEHELWWITNWPEPHAERVEVGVHGLSNGALDSDWPKVTDGRATMTQLLSRPGGTATVEPYLNLLADRRRPAVDRLPDTGVADELEADLSPIFIDMRGYGTRASTVLRIGRDGRGDITERRFTYRGRRRGTSAIRF
ncbi:NRDE family protein [Gordonia sp. SL306]|uniref:NRDE family protein n=1 Tax=Gordonia sp. SL306 TaxID=2995145 RepID=UPI00227028FA|nr:NRDE family protein [Gordonia sp. SL306]WAC55156.1 NRDE family protein [Gordonia sp. SL306]